MTVVLIAHCCHRGQKPAEAGSETAHRRRPVFMAAAMLWLTQVSAHGSYYINVLPALILMGAGLGMVFVPMQNLALFGVHSGDSGVAGALVNASQQVADRWVPRSSVPLQRAQRQERAVR